MTTREPSLEGQFVVYIYPKAVTYGFKTKDEVLNELRTRLKNLPGYKGDSFRKVNRPLYGMQLAGFAGDGILQMVTLTATQVRREYEAVDLPSGAILYIETAGEELYFFVLSSGGTRSLSEYRSLI